MQASNIAIHTEIAFRDPSLRIGMTGSRFSVNLYLAYVNNN